MGHRWAMSASGFSLPERRLAPGGSAAGLAAARTAAPGLAVEGWQGSTEPSLNGGRLALEPYETARSLAVAPDGRRFVLGSEWALRLFDQAGTELWRRPVPGIAWAVDVSGDGRLVVAAYGDGTIRWHRLSDGEELLALYPHPDRQRWVLWTPEGYYDASPGAEDLIGWQVNRGRDEAPEFYAASRFRDRFHRPDVIDRVLQELDVDRAVAKADAAAPRKQAPAQPSVVVASSPPLVSILEPGDNSRAEGGVLRLHYVVEARAGSRVKRVPILIDGQEILSQPGFDVPTDDPIDGQAAVLIGPKAQRLAVIAEGEQGSSDPVAIRLQPSAPEQGRKPNLWILAAGVSTYTSQPNLKLNFAAQDAADFVGALKRQAHGLLYENVEVQLLRDREVSWDALDNGLQ